MYHYIVNPSSGNGAYDQLQHKLKAKLRQLDIDGEFNKTLEDGDAAKITRSILKRGAKTIVVIGGDSTLNDVITTVNSAGRHSVAIGFIPLNDDSLLGSYLGVSGWQHGCELLAARRLQPFSVIHINDHSFIHSCRIISSTDETPTDLLAEIDGAFRMRGHATSIEVHNQKLLNTHLPNQLLVRFYRQQERSWWQSLLRYPAPDIPASQLHARVLILEFGIEHTATIDGRNTHDTMFRIRLSETPVKLITDKLYEQGFDSDE